LFHGYVDEGKEAAADLRDSAVSCASKWRTDSTAARRRISREALREPILGVTAASVIGTEKLGVDPSTDNGATSHGDTTRPQGRCAAGSDAILSHSVPFGASATPPPKNPGLGGMDAVYKEDPADPGSTARATLAG